MHISHLERSRKVTHARMTGFDFAQPDVGVQTETLPNSGFSSSVSLYLDDLKFSTSLLEQSMKRKRAIPVLIVIITASYFVIFRHRTQEVSLLLVNGIVYTVNEAQPSAEAIAVNEGRIVGVGSNDGIRKKFKSSRVIDLKGRAVYPGFVDAHAHMEGLGALVTNINLDGTTSVEQIQKLVADRIPQLKPGAWVRGRGWDQNKWHEKSFPTHAMLDAVTKDIPVYLRRVDGHAAWVNGKVLELARITRATPDPEGGKIVRDKAGNPTGVFIDNGIDLIDAVMPQPSEEERTEAFQRAVEECVKVGLTEVHDMGVDMQGIEIYKKLIAQKRFPFRVYVAIGGAGATWDEYLKRGPETSDNDGRLTVRALKLYADGALGSRGAALIEPYSDDPDNRGLTLTSSEQIKSAAMQALDKGFQVCIHAIGDRGNSIALSVYAEVLKSNPGKAKDARFRIEHAQVVSLNDIPRFHELGVIPSMQPAHCTSDMYWAEKRLGPKRVQGAYAWRSFMSTGSIIPAGSDSPVESPNPLWGFYAAITRQDQKGWPDGGWYPDQRMTREEALKGFTIWAAYAAFQETTKGTIEEGKVADFTILSDDIMKIEPQKILDARVEMTIIGGEIVYAATTFIATR
jgi:predicted amidohydrolase YtcJ